MKKNSQQIVALIEFHLEITRRLGDHITVAAVNTTPDRGSTGVKSLELFRSPITCDVTHLERHGPLLKVLSEQLLGQEVRRESSSVAAPLAGRSHQVERRQLTRRKEKRGLSRLRLK